MEYTFPINQHVPVGPLTDMYGHGPVTILGGGKEMDAVLYACLDCGYITHDNRRFMYEDCERADNPINTTWRERLDDSGYPEGFGLPPGEEE